MKIEPILINPFEVVVVVVVIVVDVVVVAKTMFD